MKSAHRRFRTLISMLVLLAILLGSTGCGLLDDTPEAIEPTPQGSAVSTRSAPARPTPTQAAARPTQIKDGSTWTVMIYEDGDDSILEEDAVTDLNEAERIGSSDKVNVVVQIDRYSGGFKGKQSFTGTKRYYLTQDDDLERINSEEIADLGEVNMADGQTLVSFVTWAMLSYPAEHYALILADHGAGWPGGWSDPKPANDPANALIDGYDDMLYLNEIDDALAEIQQKTGVAQLDLIGLDACLMSSLEVLTMLAPYAHYAVLSEEVEPSIGWAYSAFLEELTQNSASQGDALARSIVKSYINQDTLIVDDEARALYLERAYGSDEDLSAAALAKEEGRTVTLSAIDLSQLPALLSAVDQLALAMNKINQKSVTQARTHAQAFESVFGEDFPSPYIDLGHFAKLIKNATTSERVGQASDAVRAAIKKVVIAEKHGDKKKGATGISIYFPNSKLFKEDGADYATYTRIADRFARTSLWDDFLTAHYTGQSLVANNKPTQKITAPGAEKIIIEPIESSAESASAGKPTTLSTVITGQNVSFIYIFTGRVSDDGSQITVVDLDYIDAEATTDVDGVVYPDWQSSDGTIPLEYDWEPVQYVISDGTDSVPALLSPDTYGIGTEDTFYTVDGIFHFFNGDPDRSARLYFNGDGDMTKAIAFNGMDDSGPQHEVTPAEGDSFTVLEEIMQSGEGEETVYSSAEAGTLTFGKQVFTWDEETAPSGAYVVGFIAEDMDGNNYQEYINLTAK